MYLGFVMRLVWVWWCCWVSLGAIAQGRYDVVVSEIMSDPSPSVGLPGQEWIEVRNVSATTVNLQGWRLFDRTNLSGPLPPILLQPDSLLIICGTSAVPLLAVYGTTVAVTSFPSLDNAGDIIGIRSSNGKTIHAVEFSVQWFDNDVKEQGGWSLEIIDPRRPCLGKINWKASEAAAGGTPGRVNSVNNQLVDISEPVLIRSYTLDSVTVRLIYSEPVDSLETVTTATFNIFPALSVANVSVVPPLFNEVELKLNTPQAGTNIYKVTTSGVRDCAGNISGSSSVQTGLAVMPKPGDWIINEILFDPPPNGFDFVELYNNSSDILDLQHLFIANRMTNGSIGSLTKIYPQPYLVFPGEYIAVTESLARLQLLYHVRNPERIFQLESLPSFPDDEGYVVVVDSRGMISDEVHYNKKWHFPLVIDPRGVSLERIVFHAGSGDAMNWHSAASTAGYGTPGYQNSQSARINVTSGKVDVQPTGFSPDNDGRDDLLFITYEFPEPGRMANITVFDFSGRPVRHLVRNKLAGKLGLWTWDGLDDKGMKLPFGIYMVYAAFFDLAGKTEVFKLPASILIDAHR